VVRNSLLDRLGTSMFLDTSPQMIAKSSADRQAFIILFRSEVRKFARWQACRSGTSQVKEIT